MGSFMGLSQFGWFGLGDRFGGGDWVGLRRSFSFWLGLRRRVIFRDNEPGLEHHPLDIKAFLAYALVVVKEHKGDAVDGAG